MHLTPHDLGTALLVYLCTGALLWVLLDAFGLVEHTLQMRLKSRGVKPSLAALVIATTMMILAWPVFVFGFLAGMMVGICNRVRRSR